MLMYHCFLWKHREPCTFSWANKLWQVKIPANWHVSEVKTMHDTRSLHLSISGWTQCLFSCFTLTHSIANSTMSTIFHSSTTQLSPSTCSKWVNQCMHRWINLYDRVRTLQALYRECPGLTQTSMLWSRMNYSYQGDMYQQNGWQQAAIEAHNKGFALPCDHHLYYDQLQWNVSDAEYDMQHMGWLCFTTATGYDHELYQWWWENTTPILMHCWRLLRLQVDVDHLDKKSDEPAWYCIIDDGKHSILVWTLSSLASHSR